METIRILCVSIPFCRIPRLLDSFWHLIDSCIYTTPTVRTLSSFRQKFFSKSDTEPLQFDHIHPHFNRMAVFPNSADRDCRFPRAIFTLILESQLWYSPLLQNALWLTRRKTSQFTLTARGRRIIPQEMLSCLFFFRAFGWRNRHSPLPSVLNIHNIAWHAKQSS